MSANGPGPVDAHPTLLDLTAPLLDSVPSTQPLLIQRAEEEAPEGTVVWAREMTSGRGRGEHGWFAPRDRGLWISFLLRPTLPVERWPALTALVALAAAEAMEDLAHEAAWQAAVKWPNDVVGRHGKLAGILAQTAGGGIACGIGINLGQRRDDFPEEIRGRASSLWIEGIRDPGGDEPVPPLRMAEAFDRRLARSYRRFQDGDDAFLREGLCARFFLRGAGVVIEDEGTRSIGRAVDLGPAGELILEREGARRSVHSGTVVAYEHSEDARNRGSNDDALP